MSSPFLSIITRTCRRPRMLRDCIESVLAQSCWDFEHLFIVDLTGVHKENNILWANGQFHRYRDLVQGKYVFMLDDDGVLCDQQFIYKAKQLADKTNPDVMLVHSLSAQADYSLSTLPPAEIWALDWENGERPSSWSGHGYNTISKRIQWQRAVRAYLGQKRGGDWHYHTELFRGKVSVHRLWNTISARSVQRGNGATFEVGPKDDWFTPIAQMYGLEHISSNVWRLQCQ